MLMQPRLCSSAVTLALVTMVLFPSIAMSRQLSPSQMQYISKNGKPDFFFIAFQDKQLDSKVKRLVPINPPAVSEVWYYAKKGVRYLFSNGKFVSERAVDAITLQKLLPGTTLLPSDISFGLHRREIEQRFGKADKVEEAKIDNHEVVVLRYLQPKKGIKSLTFADDQLQAVLIGFAFNGKTNS